MMKKLYALMMGLMAVGCLRAMDFSLQYNINETKEELCKIMSQDEEGAKKKISNELRRRFTRFDTETSYTADLLTSLNELKREMEEAMKTVSRSRSASAARPVSFNSEQEK